MNPRRLALAAAAAATLAAVTSGVAVPAATAAKPRPNIVLIQTDDQTAASMRYMPWVRRLIGRAGTTFSRSFVSLPQCCPSRATLLTGQYAHNHRVLQNKAPRGGYKRLDKSNWLPVWLQRAGYHTIQLGRTLNGYGTDEETRTEIPPGWNEWYAPLDLRDAAPGNAYDYFDFWLNQNGTLVRHTGRHQNDVYRSMAVPLLSRAAVSRRPFFFYLAYSAPHFSWSHGPGDPSDLYTAEPAVRHRDAFANTPLPRPASFNEWNVSDKPQAISDRPLLGPRRIASIQEGYQQELESLLSVDQGVRAVYRAVARAGELKNTIFVYTSDNGYFHGQHRIHAGKGFVYEPAIRVPLLIRGPGVPRRRRLGQMVSNADVAPTLLQAARARPRRRQDGRSLFTLMRDPTRELGRDLLLQGAVGDPNVPSFAAIRTYRYVYAEHFESGEYELYDLKRDRYQLRSLDSHPAYDAVRERLTGRLWRLRRCRGRSCRAAPRIRLLVRARRGARGCLRGRVRLRLSGRHAGDVSSADVFAGRRRVARDRRAPFAVTLRRGKLRRGRRVRLRVRTFLLDGRRLTVDRRLRACR